MKQKSKYKIFAVFFLILLNIISHFIPFERRSLAPDDYGYLARFKKTGLLSLQSYFLKYPDRPLNQFVLDLQSKFIGENVGMGLMFTFLSTVFVLIAVFFLLEQLFNDAFLAFIGSFLYCLLPNKLETYHSLIFFNMNTITSIYILSFLFFINFAKNKKWLYFFLSFFSYSIGLFWYEIGFFMPIVFLAYSYLYNKKNITKYIGYFLVPLGFYIVFRLYGTFNIGKVGIPSHQINLSKIPIAFIDLFHNYAGRYMIRSIIYGFYKFASIEQPWLSIIIFLDITLLAFVATWLRREREMGKIDIRLIFFAVILFISFLIPNFLIGAIGGRHLSLPSIGVAIFLIWLLKKIKRKWHITFLIIVAFCLVVCQGNAWTQVVACRINNAVYNTLKEIEDKLTETNSIIIDTKSFADNIPFAFIQRDYNILNTYYGAQAFEDWGLTSMVGLVVDGKKSIYIAKESPRIKDDNLIEFIISTDAGYRSVKKEIVVVPQKGVVIIDFKSVYRKGFNNGKR